MKHAALANLDVAGIGSKIASEGRSRQLTRAQWVAICAGRLIELRPASEHRMLRATAADMALTLQYFDPTLAAEMEHEGGMLDD